MASANWKGGKAKSTGQAKAWFRHNSKEERIAANHSNTHIDKSRTPLNWSYRGLSYAGRCAAYDKRLSEIDQGKPGSGKNARTVLQAVDVYAPEALRGDLPKLKEWFDRVGQIAEQQFGSGNVIDMAVDVDEVHDYTDADTLEERLSVEHGHLWLVPEVDGKLNGKEFSSRKNIVAFNDALQYMTEREFGCKFNDGSKAKRRGTVEQLKQRSLKAEVEQLQAQADTLIVDAMNRAAEITTEARRDARSTRREADQDREQAKRERGAAWADAQAVMDDADDYAQATKDDADDYARRRKSQADQDAAKAKKDAQDEADRIRQQAQADAQATREKAQAEARRIAEAAQAQLREKLQAQIDGRRDEYKALQNAHRAAQEAARRDVMAWDAQEARRGLKSLLAASGAAVAAYTLPAATAARIDRAIKATPIMERLARMNAQTDARNAAHGPTAVEGPTM